jgi:hypothetical protein
MTQASHASAGGVGDSTLANLMDVVKIRSSDRDLEMVEPIKIQMPGADSPVNIEGLPWVDYLWKLWSPTFKNDEHLRSIKETLSSPGTMTAALKYYGGLSDAVRTGRLPMNEMHRPTLTIYGSTDPTASYSVVDRASLQGAI